MANPIIEYYHLVKNFFLCFGISDVYVNNYDQYSIEFAIKEEGLIDFVNNRISEICSDDDDTQFRGDCDGVNKCKENCVTFEASLLEESCYHNNVEALKFVLKLLSREDIDKFGPGCIFPWTSIEVAKILVNYQIPLSYSVGVIIAQSENPELMKILLDSLSDEEVDEQRRILDEDASYSWLAIMEKYRNQRRMKTIVRNRIANNKPDINNLVAWRK